MVEKPKTERSIGIGKIKLYYERNTWYDEECDWINGMGTGVSFSLSLSPYLSYEKTSGPVEKQITVGLHNGYTSDLFDLILLIKRRYSSFRFSVRKELDNGFRIQLFRPNGYRSNHPWFQDFRIFSKKEKNV